MGYVSELAEYAGARAAVGAAGLFPHGSSLALGGRLGAAAYRLRMRRDVVLQQIAAAFPERDRAWVERTAAACYRHFGREAAVMARLQRGGAPVPPAGTAMDASARLALGRMAGGEGTIVVTGHFGNWEVAGAVLAQRGVPLAAVVKRQRNARFDAWLTAGRRRLGVEPVYMEEAPLAIPRLLAAGRSVALVADQDARGRGVTVTFLGRPASTFRGPARLALATGAPLVFGVTVREGDGYRLCIEPVRGRSAPGESAVTGDPAIAGESAITGDPAAPGDPELDLTRRWVAALERHVRRRPEQYFWFHRRWKSGVGHGRNERGGDAVPHPERAQPVESTRPNLENRR